MADLSIYGPLLRGPKSVADYDREARAGELDQLQLLEGRDKRAATQRGVERQQQLQGLMGSLPAGATDLDRLQALRGGAFFDQADALDKSMVERDKSRATVAKDTAETKGKDYDLQRKRYEHRLGGLQQFTSHEDARQWLADGVTAGDLSMKEAKTMHDHMPKDPQGFGDWRDRTILSLMDAGKQAGYIKPDANAQLSATTQRQNNADTNARTAADAAAGRRVTMRGQDMVDDRTRETHNATVGKPFEVTDPDTGQPTLVRQDRQGNLSRVEGFQPKGMGATKLTEDQGKATGWLTQATNAHANMTAALEATPSAAKPGLPDMIAAIPSLGIGEAAGNKLRGSDRQRYMQASSSLSEALLRAATGAGVNKEEAAQKVRELTPQFGDGDDVIKQKMAAIPVYIESLKVRAGPGAKLVPGIFDRARPAAPAPAAASGFRLIGTE